jgi:hypothetical protein
MAELLYVNRNPLKLRTGDCVYRGLSWFLGISWREAVDDIVRWCADRGIVSFNYKGTINKYLKDKGYEYHTVPRKGMTVGEFCDNFAEKGKTYLIHCQRHVTIVQYIEDYGGSAIVDTWDCSDKKVEAYFVKESMK